MTLPATPDPARQRPFYPGQMADSIRLLNAADSPLGQGCDRPAGLRCAIDLRLLTDASLPGVNGCQTAQTAHQHRPGLRRLLTIGHAGQTASRRKFPVPGTQMLSNGTTRDTLAAQIDNILQDCAQQSPKTDTDSNNKTEEA